MFLLQESVLWFTSWTKMKMKFLIQSDSTLLFAGSFAGSINFGQISQCLSLFTKL